MAIVKMNKFTMFAFESQKEELLGKLQELEGVQFINLQNIEEKFDFLESDSCDDKASEFDGELTKVDYTLDFLRKYIPAQKGIKALKEGKESLKYEEIRNFAPKINWNDTYESVKKIDATLNSYKNEVSRLQTEIEGLKPWIKFDASLSDLKKLKNCIYMFGTVPKNVFTVFKEEFNSEVTASYIEELGEAKEGICIFIIGEKSFSDKIEDITKKYAFARTNLNYEGVPSDIISSYEKRIEDAHAKEEELTQEIPQKFTGNIKDLEIVHEYFDMEADKAKVCTNFLKTDKVIALEGWVPSDSKDDFIKVLNDTMGNNYHVEFKEPSEGDKVPILLKNNRFAEPYELITAMYSMPSYGEVDPTPILTPFFFVFFGMMLSDAGYGLLILIGSTLAIKFFNLNKNTKKFMRLFASISISTIIWGILYGSYFGDAPTLFVSSGIKPVWLDPSKDPMSVLVIAMTMGIIHIFTGLGIKAYELIKNGKPWDALFDVGFWYATVGGAVLLLVSSSLNMPGLGTAAKYILIAGAAGLILTQGRSNKNIVGKIAGGLFGLYGITGYLGDILSYSRLLALGLATGLIGSSFNLIIKLLGKGIGAVIAGILIFVCGHIFNLAINALGAYVHACRLQYLEFFGKFYTGGGKAFKPFKSKNKYINVIKED